MIKIFQGNILDAPENIIAHQVNCMGVMGAGLAKQIKNKYPNVFKDYQKYLINSEFPTLILGECQFVKVDSDKYIANLFGQYKFGTDKQQTDYKALEEALFTLKVNAKDHNLSVALPYGIGCGLAGGAWNVVYPMIEEVFKDYDVTIYKLV